MWGPWFAFVCTLHLRTPHGASGRKQLLPLSIRRETLSFINEADRITKLARKIEFSTRLGSFLVNHLNPGAAPTMPAKA